MYSSLIPVTATADADWPGAALAKVLTEAAHCRYQRAGLGVDAGEQAIQPNSCCQCEKPRDAARYRGRNGIREFRYRATHVLSRAHGDDGIRGQGVARLAGARRRSS
jgi:hypothetical protein